MRACVCARALLKYQEQQQARAHLVGKKRISTRIKTSSVPSSSTTQPQRRARTPARTRARSARLSHPWGAQERCPGRDVLPPQDPVEPPAPVRGRGGPGCGEHHRGSRGPRPGARPAQDAPGGRLSAVERNVCRSALPSPCPYLVVKGFKNCAFSTFGGR